MALRILPHVSQILALVAALLTLVSPAFAERRALVEQWAFHRGPVAGAERFEFDDRAWTQVAVPHDWSIEDLPGTQSPLLSSAPGGSDSGFFVGGEGWYRRTIALSQEDVEGIVLLQFEAVYMDATIWVNGLRAGGHRYGYTAFSLDVSDLVRPGENVIAVRVNHQEPSSRWYSGSGIIRPVHLETLERIHLDPNGVAVTTIEASRARGRIAVSSSLNNRTAERANVRLVSEVIDASGRVVRRLSDSAVIEPGSSTTVHREIALRRPALWSTKAPNLYSLRQTVFVAGRAVDRRDTRFGIRTIAIDPERGFLLNGETVLLRGGNFHHDNYMIGAAGFPRADERKVELMHAAGYNAIRSAHNPASQATLEAADRLGILVINEAFDMWQRAKRRNDYSRFFAEDWRADIQSLVVTGRNHPSVVMWSIGNEIPEQDQPHGHNTAAELAAFVRALDPSRPTTVAVNNEGPPVAPFFATVDVAGYNYRPQYYAPDHETYPRRVMYGSESYPADVFAYWRAVETMPWVIGDFVWTAFDYLGEASIGYTGYSSDYGRLGPYPWHLAYVGEIDATGARRPNSFYREIVWGTGENPVAAFVRWPGEGGSLPNRDYFPADAHREWVFPDLHRNWTWPGRDGQTIDVVVYSAAPEVELFLNGASLGRRAMGISNQYTTTYPVPYAPGVLRAVAYAEGQTVGSWEIQSTGAPAALRVSVDRPSIRADGLDLAYVVVEVVDAEGRLVSRPSAEHTVEFEVAGSATLVGLGNGNPYGNESFQATARSTFDGRVVAVIRGGLTPGESVLRVSAPGLRSASVQIRALAE